MSDQAPVVEPKKKVSNSILKKLGLIFLIFVLLQIPLTMVNGIMNERQMYNVSYSDEYKGAGVGQQTVIGPVLTVPYHYQSTEKQEIPTKAGVEAKTVSVTTTETGYLHFFPEALTVNSHLEPETRDEGKYKSILYSTDLEFKGAFNTADFEKKGIKEKDIVWKNAFIALGVSDLRGIRKATTLNWSGQQYKFVPGTNGLNLFSNGQYVLLTAMQKSGNYPFAFTVHLNGSRDLNIFPAGKENKITLTSSWAEPAFTGGFLPNQKTINKKGFNASWEVSYFSRNLPQLWTDQDSEIKNSLAQYMVGVTLATPVEFYRTAIRAVKYGSLFIIMTFLAFFIFERLTRLRIHEVQYLLVGLALCLFFLLLIAITEWVPFAWAYFLASITTIAQITWYTQAFSKTASSNRLWKIMAGLLSILYIYLYVLLQLDKLSLLFGSLGLFIALTAVMYVTRDIDWYSEREPS